MNKLITNDEADDARWRNALQYCCKAKRRGRGPIDVGANIPAIGCRSNRHIRGGNELGICHQIVRPVTRHVGLK